ncbi:DUF2867 domain-containing protein [Nocardioides sp.]|uniref:DUF2867 domain-containing protein n=1 Tax=Nocardioides sp. TaxID=35761 RepID=UPI0035619AA4
MTGDPLHSSHRSSLLDVAPARAWAAVVAAGGRPRWYVDAAPWRVRGGIDRLVGGAGRRWPVPGQARLSPGDTAGFWRVLKVDDARGVLLLEAAVRSPGTVTLRTSVQAVSNHKCRVEQVVTFTPRGALGRLYLLADLPARAAVIALCHRTLIAEITAGRT